MSAFSTARAQLFLLCAGFLRAWDTPRQIPCPERCQALAHFALDVDLVRGCGEQIPVKNTTIHLELFIASPL